MTEQELDQLTPAQIKAAYEQEAANPPAEEVIVYERRVKDPDGVERVYRSEDSMEDLIDKIVAGRAEHQPPTPVTPKVRTADEEFCLAQRFASEPSKAFDEMLLEKTGLTPEAFRAQVQATVNQQNNAVAEAFVASTPEYLANDHNGKVMTDYLKKLGQDENKPLTVDDLKKAYEACKPLLQEREPEFDPWNVSLDELREKAGGLPKGDVAGSDWDF